MSQEQDDYWRARPDMPSEAPEHWVNRDYGAAEHAPPPSRAWMVWTAMILGALFALSGLWSSLEPLLK